MSQTWSGGFFPGNSTRGGAPVGGGQDRGFARPGEFLDAQTDPDARLHSKEEGGARQTAGPFHRAGHGQGGTANRTAAGPLNATWKGRGQFTRSGVPAVRRT